MEAKFSVAIITLTKEVQGYIRDHAVSLRAAQLTLATLLAAVPILTIVLGILRLTPAMASMETNLVQFVEQHLAPGSSETLVPYLLSFSEQAKNLPAVGVITLLVTALLLLNSFEAGVQQIWQVKQVRKLRERLLIYWSILTMGPILLAAAGSLYGTLLSYQIQGLSISTLFNQVVEFGGFVIYFIALFVLNYLTPNTDTQLKPTALSALIGVVALSLVNWAFSNFAQFFANYQVVYGAFAALPIFLVWLQITWLVILISVCINAALHRNRLFIKLE
ncbi:YihY family inner membrane protein [Maribrevibacterium harenarium]|nr:YihY family inner membrane protein [Maribrevibacterium harenarium]